MPFNSVVDPPDYPEEPLFCAIHCGYDQYVQSLVATGNLPASSSCRNHCFRVSITRPGQLPVARGVGRQSISFAMKKLTPAVKKRITVEWHAHFPTLGEYKPMWLLRRNGPLLFGLCLDRSSHSAEYVPTFHVHCLCRAVDDVSLMLWKPLLSVKHQVKQSIELRFHEQLFPEAVERFQSQNPILLKSDLDFDDVSRLYGLDIRNRLHQVPFFEIQDLILLAAYLELPGYATSVLEYAKTAMVEWPDYVQERLRQRIGGVEAWSKNMNGAIAEPESLAEIVESEIKKHKLENVPVYKLTPGSGGVPFWE